MKLIEVARQQRDLLNEGIAYIAVWKEAQKNGKASWFTEDFFAPDTDEQSDPIFDREQKVRLAEIFAKDENAVLLNGYYHSWIGSADEPLNAASIAKGIENHYLMHNALISTYFADEPETPTADETVTNKTATTVTNDHGGEYDENGEYIQGTGEAVCSPEDGMQASDVPEFITIELTATNVKEDILRSLIESKATLIKAALGDDAVSHCGRHGELPIEFTETGTVAFTWLRFGADGDTVKAWSTFLAAACKFSKTAKRITAKDKTVENEKFAFRTFLVKIKLNGAEGKWARRRLLQNLSGDAAFATPESKAKWVAKHQKGKGGAGDAE